MTLEVPPQPRNWVRFLNRLWVIAACLWFVFTLVAALVEAPAVRSLKDQWPTYNELKNATPDPEHGEPIDWLGLGRTVIGCNKTNHWGPGEEVRDWSAQVPRTTSIRGGADEACQDLFVWWDDKVSAVEKKRYDAWWKVVFLLPLVVGVGLPLAVLALGHGLGHGIAWAVRGLRAES